MAMAVIVFQRLGSHLTPMLLPWVPAFSVEPNVTPGIGAKGQNGVITLFKLETPGASIRWRDHRMGVQPGIDGALVGIVIQCVGKGPILAKLG